MSSTSTAVAVFDISSSSVGGAHVLLTTKNDITTTTILVQERRDSGLDEELDIERFVENTAKALEVVISHVRTADIHHPDLIQVVLASPWYNSYTRTVRHSHPTLVTCTKRLVDGMIEKEIEAFLKESGEAFSKEFKVAEKQLSQIKLNGYESADPYGKKVQSIELVITLTMVPIIVLDRFETILRRSYGDRTIMVTTGPYATFVALRDNGKVAQDCVVIDVGEEVTDIAFIKNNVFLYQHSFPVGTYELYRQLSAKTGSTVESRALIEAYRLHKLSKTSAKLIDKALTAFSTSWQTALQEIVEQGQYGFQFPGTCYITADARFETIFPDIVSGNAFLLHSAGVKELQAHFVSAYLFSGRVRANSSDEPDAALVIAALFSERLL
jgi:hypothetical protein